MPAVATFGEETPAARRKGLSGCPQATELLWQSAYRICISYCILLCCMNEGASLNFHNNRQNHGTAFGSLIDKVGENIPQLCLERAPFL